MSLLQRLLRALGYEKAPQITFHDEVASSLEELSRRWQRPERDIAADLISQALVQRQEAEKMLQRWRELSQREQEVTALICLNYTNRQIAQRLSISPETVKTHIRNLLRKLGMRSKEQLRQALKDWDFSAWERL